MFTGRSAQSTLHSSLMPRRLKRNLAQVQHCISTECVIQCQVTDASARSALFTVLTNIAEVVLWGMCEQAIIVISLLVVYDAISQANIIWQWQWFDSVCKER